MKDPIDLVIPMTGIGKRFVDAGYETLKPLIQTGIGSMIQGVLKNYPTIHRPLFIVSRDHPQKHLAIKEIYSHRPEARICEIAPHKKGPSFAVWQSREHLRKEIPVVINYCDFGGIWDEGELLDQITQQEGLLLTYTGFHPHMLRSTKFAYVRKESTGLVSEVREKQSFTDRPMTEEASSGTYGFLNKEILLEAIYSQMTRDISLQGEFYTSLTYVPMLERKMNVRTMIIDKFFQWGTPEDLRDFQYWNHASKRDVIKARRDMAFHSKSNAIVLAAGLGTRLSESGEPKALIPIFSNPLWTYSARNLLQCRERIVVTRDELKSGIEKSNFFEFEIHALQVATSGQAETALRGLEQLDDMTVPVHIASCDNMLFEVDVEEIERLFDIFDIVVWTANNYAFANTNPNQFSWIVSQNSHEFEVKNIFFKEANPPPHAEVFIGNISFKSSAMAKDLIEKAFFANRRETRGELYLDHVIMDALQDHRYRVAKYPFMKFSSIGTPLELATARYWEEVYKLLERQQ